MAKDDKEVEKAPKKEGVEITNRAGRKVIVTQELKEKMEAAGEIKHDE